MLEPLLAGCCGVAGPQWPAAATAEEQGPAIDDAQPAAEMVVLHRDGALAGERAPRHVRG